MRQERIIQATLFEVFAEHEIGRELKAISQWLDEHRALLSLAARDLRRHGIQETGRHGLPAEAVVRCALLKQYRQLSYEELAFHLEDSASFRAFARLPLSWSPRKSVLHKTISAISAASWEAIKRAAVCSARQSKLESGTMVRIDSTVTQALMHAPTDSSLLWDAVRVMVRLLKHASALPGAPSIIWRNHRRLAKKRALAIQYSRGTAHKAKLYRELIAATRATVSALEHVVQRLAAGATIEVELWRGQVRHYLPLIERIITQAERRVLAGEAVPSGEKLVSLFETHADIIVKGSREVHYGHKLNLTTGKSGLILDVVVEAGNPADAERSFPMLERHMVRKGKEPLALPQAEKLPSRHRGQHILPETGFWSRALHLARARSLQSIRLVVSRCLQPRPVRTPQAGIARQIQTPAAPPSLGRSLSVAVLVKRFCRR